MGGGEAIMLASDPQYKDLMKDIRGWVLESPFIAFPKGFEPGFLKMFFGRLAGKVLPYMGMKNIIPPENVTRDPAVIESIKNDKLIHNYGTLEGLAGMLDRTELLGSGKAKLNEGVRSIWLGHGTDDKGTSYEASRKWFDDQTQVQDKEFKTYEGWFHQLHADKPDNRGVFAKDVADWILGRSGEETRGDGSKL
jgi:acylglycerol lipase